MSFKAIGACLLVLALATVAGAQTKISGTAQCSKPETQNAIEVGDRPNHSFAIGQSKCTWSKPLEIAETQSKEGVNTAFTEITGNMGRGHGFYLDTMASGDKAHARYQGTSTFKDGVPQALEGTWAYVGGTGKLKGLKGKGTYKGKTNPDGSVTYEVEGEYQLPK